MGYADGSDVTLTTAALGALDELTVQGTYTWNRARPSPPLSRPRAVQPTGRSEYAKHHASGLLHQAPQLLGVHQLAALQSHQFAAGVGGAGPGGCAGGGLQ